MAVNTLSESVVNCHLFKDKSNYYILVFNQGLQCIILADIVGDEALHLLSQTSGLLTPPRCLLKPTRNTFLTCS